jgi:ketosteroid isomerase-like protein
VTSAEERIELVRRGFDAYQGGDIEAVLDHFDPEMELQTADGLPNAGTYRGHEGFARWAQQWEEAWDDFRPEPGKIEAVGERHAVAEVLQKGRGRGSGVEVEMTAGYVFEYVGGRAIYVALHPTFNEAMGVARQREGASAADKGD